MQNRPDAATLLDIVGELLRTMIVPRLEGPVAYQARIAANLVAMAEREIRGAPAGDAAELAGLRALLAMDGDLATLNAEFAQRIAAGALTLESPGVLDHLWSTTLAKLAVDQPSFPRLREYA